MAQDDEEVKALNDEHHAKEIDHVQEQQKESVIEAQAVPEVIN